MKTATLVINDTKKFDDAVFQMQTGNTRTNYDGWLKDVIKTLENIQKKAETNDTISSEEEYTLGDVINFLSTLDVEIKENRNPISDVYPLVQDWIDENIEEMIEDFESRYYKLDNNLTIVLSMDGDFSRNRFQYERVRNNIVYLPAISIRHYSDYGTPDEWQYLRMNDDDDKDPVADYAIGSENEAADILSWVSADLDEYLCNQ